MIITPPDQVAGVGVQPGSDDTVLSVICNIPGQRPCKVGYEAAKRWLSNQQGFKSSWTHSKNDPDVRRKLTEVRTGAELGVLIGQHRIRFSAVTAKAMVDFPSVELEAWERIGAVTTAEMLHAADLAAGEPDALIGGPPCQPQQGGL